MAITGRSLGEAAARFRDHLNSVLARTITQIPLSLLVFEGKAQAMLTFRQDGAPVGVPINSRFGPLRLWIGQVCGASTRDDGTTRLYTSRYRYTLSVGASHEPLLRWEYERARPTAASLWCRHHLQGAIELKVGDTTVRLNDWHLPTGYVPLEEVIRFCVVDLGVSPVSDDWDAVLVDSYQRFKTDFTSL